MPISHYQESRIPSPISSNVQGCVHPPWETHQTQGTNTRTPEIPSYSLDIWSSGKSPTPNPLVRTKATPKTTPQNSLFINLKAGQPRCIGWAISEKACLAGLGLNQKLFAMSWAQLELRKGPWREVTDPGARDEVREFSHSPMQNGLLNTLHIEEQRDVHAAGMREVCADLDNPTDTQLETDR